MRRWDARLNAFVDVKMVRRYDTELNAFVDVQGAYITEAGVRRQVWPDRLYIIRNGVQDNDITGGWKWLQVVGTPTATWKSGYLELTNTYGAGSTNYYITQKAMPLAGKSVLCISLETTNTGTSDGQHIGLWNNNTFPANNLTSVHYATNYFKSNQPKQVIRIPFQEASGKYLGIGCEAISGKTILKVYDVWFE